MFITDLLSNEKALINSQRTPELLLLGLRKANQGEETQSEDTVTNKPKS